MNFVTGGTGLVGSHILLELAKNNAPIIALKRASSDISLVQKLFDQHNKTAEFKKIKWVISDLNNISALIGFMKNVDYVYHCAAFVSFNPNDRNELNSVNIDGTANMVNAALEAKPQKFIYISSTAAIGKQPKKALIDETCEWNIDHKNGAYSFSKHFAEREIWRGVEEGLDVVILNPSVILGSGNWNSSSTRLFNTVNNGMKFYSKGENAFVDVRDVAKIALTLAKSNLINERFLVLSENRSFRSIMDLIARELNKKPATYYAYPKMAYIIGLLSEIWSFFSGKSPLITRSSSESANAIQHYSNAKIKNALNYEFISVEKCIADTCLAYKEDNL